MKIYNKDLWSAGIVFGGCSWGFYYCSKMTHIEITEEWFATTNMLYLWTMLCLLVSNSCFALLIVRYTKAYKAKKKLEAILFMPDETKDVVIGTEYIHTKGRYKLITITNKTKNSVQFKDGHGYINWITFDEFTKFFTLKNLKLL